MKNDTQHTCGCRKKKIRFLAILIFLFMFPLYSFWVGYQIGIFSGLTNQMTVVGSGSHIAP